jgi:uncharacterized protein YbjQ (UPF0145 family)
MTPFGFGRSKGGPDAETRLAIERRREADVARITQGSLPIAAQQRLDELSQREKFFTSGLSVSDFLLTRRYQVQPIAQVMGSSVYHVGWQRYPWQGGWGAGTILELGQLTNAWNDARARAVNRLDQEARLAGADAVIDVTFVTRGHDFLRGNGEIEIVANGTAVRLPGGVVAPRADGAPRLSDLSAADFTLLHRSGYDPVGIVCATSVTYVVASRQTRQMTTGGWLTARPNAELTDFSQGVYAARENAISRAQYTAQQLGADGIVGVDLDVNVEIREYDSNDVKYKDLIVTVHVVGTGIVARGDHEPMNPTVILRQGAKTT